VACTLNMVRLLNVYDHCFLLNVMMFGGLAFVFISLACRTRRLSEATASTRCVLSSSGIFL